MNAAMTRVRLTTVISCVRVIVKVLLAGLLSAPLVPCVLALLNNDSLIGVIIFLLTLVFYLALTVFARVYYRSLLECAVSDKRPFVGLLLLMLLSSLLYAYPIYDRANKAEEYAQERAKVTALLDGIGADLRGVEERVKASNDRVMAFRSKLEIGAGETGLLNVDIDSLISDIDEGTTKVEEESERLDNIKIRFAELSIDSSAARIGQRDRTFSTDLSQMEERFAEIDSQANDLYARFRVASTDVRWMLSVQGAEDKLSQLKGDFSRHKISVESLSDRGRGLLRRAEELAVEDYDQAVRAILALLDDSQELVAETNQLALEIDRFGTSEKWQAGPLDSDHPASPKLMAVWQHLLDERKAFRAQADDFSVDSLRGLNTSVGHAYRQIRDRFLTLHAQKVDRAEELLKSQEVNLRSLKQLEKQALELEPTVRSFSAYQVYRSDVRHHSSKIRDAEQSAIAGLTSLIRGFSGDLDDYHYYHYYLFRYPQIGAMETFLRGCAELRKKVDVGALIYDSNALRLSPSYAPLEEAFRKFYGGYQKVEPACGTIRSYLEERGTVSSYFRESQANIDFGLNRVRERIFKDIDSLSADASALLFRQRELNQPMTEATASVEAFGEKLETRAREIEDWRLSSLFDVRFESLSAARNTMTKRLEMLAAAFKRLDVDLSRLSSRCKEVDSLVLAWENFADVFEGGWVGGSLLQRGDNNSNEASLAYSKSSTLDACVTGRNLRQEVERSYAAFESSAELKAAQFRARMGELQRELGVIWLAAFSLALAVVVLASRLVIVAIKRKRLRDRGRFESETSDVDVDFFLNTILDPNEKLDLRRYAVQLIDLKAFDSVEVRNKIANTLKALETLRSRESNLVYLDLQEALGSVEKRVARDRHSG